MTFRRGFLRNKILLPPAYIITPMVLRRRQNVLRHDLRWLLRRAGSETVVVVLLCITTEGSRMRPVVSRGSDMRTVTIDARGLEKERRRWRKENGSDSPEMGVRLESAAVPSGWLTGVDTVERFWR
ncbi:hypothetical protein SESBI_48348 [Sesbania bispinosa]|nr:hypothetical protein SESBI_48348 [Sesbania bispinosa]